MLLSIVVEFLERAQLRNLCVMQSCTNANFTNTDPVNKARLHYGVSAHS